MWPSVRMAWSFKQNTLPSRELMSVNKVQVRDLKGSPFDLARRSPSALRNVQAANSTFSVWRKIHGFEQSCEGCLESPSKQLRHVEKVE